MSNESTYDEFSTIGNLAREVTESFQREGWNTVNNAATTGSPESDLEELGMTTLEGQNGTVKVQRMGNSDEVTVKYQPDGDVSNPRAIDSMLSRKNDSNYDWLSV
jgi:hypothetical protein